MNFNNKTFSYEIVKSIGVLAEKDGHWKKEINIVIWNDGEPKYDIRDWSEDHKRMNKGLTFTKDEIISLKDILKKEFEG